MKKNVIVVSLVFLCISISAFAYSELKSTKQQTQPKTNNLSIVNADYFLSTINKTTVADLVYKMESRFIHTVTLSDIQKATSIKDIIPQKEAESLSNYSKNRLTIGINKGKSMVVGYGEKFSSEQLEILKKVSYSTDLSIEADCKTSNQAGELSPYDLVYYMTIVPEKEAEFSEGYDALINQIKEKTRTKISHIKMNNIKAGKVRFIVGKDGKISRVKLDSTCGYEDVDETLVDLFNHIEGDWNPARDINGQAVEQEMVFFFGIFGC